MAEISAAEYAKGQSISARRVQAAAAAGVLPARKIAGRWVIDAPRLGTIKSGCRCSRARCARCSRASPGPTHGAPDCPRAKRVA